MKGVYPDKRRWNELKTACKERAGWQCEYVYPNKKRCSMREDEIRKSKRRRGRPYFVHLHTAPYADGPTGRATRKTINMTPRLPDHHHRYVAGGGQHRGRDHLRKSRRLCLAHRWYRPGGQEDDGSGGGRHCSSPDALLARND